MNIIAVDDEPYALQILSREIEISIPNCTISAFPWPDAAIAYAENHKVNLAFLDIEMGGMDGLARAKRLKEIHGKTNIVFVTGYSKYAVDAFSVSASDYLLKPVSAGAIARAVERLRNPMEEGYENKLRVQCFGNFEVFLQGSPLYFPRKKAKELLAYLVDRKGASVTTPEIASILWEDKPYDKAVKNQVHTIITTLIKTLNEAGARDVIIKNWNQLSVDTAKFDCDSYRFEQGDLAAINAYNGEYMANYSWAEFSIGRFGI